MGRRQCSIVLAVALSCRAVGALHPRPPWRDYASYARWLVHESDYAVVATHRGSDVFGNIVSISDGNGYEHSTGVIYTYITPMSTTYKDVTVDDRVSLTFTEKALGDGNSGGCAGSTAENPPCGRLTISGRLTRVPIENETVALQYLFARQPEMQSWPHDFMPFWMAPENITSFFLINFFGGATHPTVEEFLAAPWQDNSSSVDPWADWYP